MRPSDRPSATSRATSNPGRTYLSVSPPKPGSQPADADSATLGDLRRPTILVEKSKKLLTVFDDGQVVKRYPAAVGGNVGDKEREGDKRTPEGEFYVCIKKPTTKYVRALGLSYPDIEDAQRGLRQGLIGQGDYDRIAWAIRNRRQPPWETKLGGAILIHGDRRGGRDTQGCVALEDKDILELYPKIPMGTRVIIRP
jgi:murein L,D-transpeptidase YafK